MKSFHRYLLSLLLIFSISVFVPLSVFAQNSNEVANAELTENSDESDSYSELSSDWYVGKLIKSVKFKGLKSLDSKDLDGISASYIGKKFTSDLFDELVNKIYALELFEEIEPLVSPGDSKNNTVAITFNVKEYPSVRRIIISGNKQIRSAEIKDKISIKEKDIFVSDKLSADERAIRAYYIEKGFQNATVSSSFKETKNGIEVTFLVDEGRATVVSEIHFSGNKNYKEKTLINVLKLKKKGLFSKGAFQESTLESDKQAILNRYLNDGYMDASVLNVTKEVVVNEKKNRDELIITFHVQEGEKYKYEGISFVGNEIFSSEKLNSLIKLKPGSTFDQSKLNDGFQKIADLYYENGYTSNQFQPIPSKDAENRTIFYTLSIVENARSHIESISIKGNKKTKEYVIRREIPIDSGDIFSKSKIQTSMRNLYNLQYFSAVVPDVVPGSEENLVNLVFSVEEQSTTSIEFGVTFSGVSDPDELPFALFAKWQDSNLGGTGKTLAVSTSLATSEQSLGVSLSENWLFGLPVSASISTGISHSKLSSLCLAFDEDGFVDDDSYYMDYEQWKWTTGFSIGRRWTPDWAILSVATGITTSLKNNIYDEDVWIPVDTSVSEYSNKWGWQNSVWASFSVDDRDVNYDPSTGWFASQRLTWYGLTPYETEYFLRSDSKLEKYFTLLDWKLFESWSLKFVLAGYTGLSFLMPAPNYGIGNTSKLYIDGMFNGRGWTNIYNDVRGRGSWFSSLELRMPVVPRILALDWFGDAALIKDSPYELFHNVKVEDFYFSTGPGIRFTIPQFPLRLLFANTFRVVDNDIKWEDRWKFVLSFCIVNK